MQKVNWFVGNLGVFQVSNSKSEINIRKLKIADRNRKASAFGWNLVFGVLSFLITNFNSKFRY